MEGLENIKRRLKKLMALYESAKKVDSEGEAAACAEAIQRILTQYNLTMDEVDLGEKPEVETQDINGRNHNHVGGAWCFKLLQCICDFNFCQCYMRGGRYNDLIVVGRRENIEVCKWLHSLLSDRFNKMSIDRWNQYRHSPEYIADSTIFGRTMTGGKFRRAYLFGCVRGLREKLEEEKRKNDEELNQKITSLVICRNAEIEDFVNKNFNVGKGVTLRSVSRHIAEIGRNDGRQTQLYKPIASKQRSTATTSSVKMLN